MTEDEILSEFRSVEALLEGHFAVISRHSAYYLQCARLLMNPERAGRIALAITQKSRVSPQRGRGRHFPAMGESSLAMKWRARLASMRCLLNVHGVFALRRGAFHSPGAKFFD